MNKSRGSILKTCTYFLAFFLPLFYLGSNMLYPHIAPKTFLFYAVIEIMSAIWIYTIIVDPSYRLRKKTLLYMIPLGLYVVWMTLSTILAINPGLAFWSSFARGMGLLTIYHGVFLLLIVASLVSRFGTEYINRLMRWFINGGFFLALTIWFGSTGLDLKFNLLKNDGGGGLSGNSSLGAAYLMFVIAFAVVLLFRKTVSKKTKYWISVVTATILFSPLFIDIHGLLSGNGLLGDARGAILGMIVGIMASILWYLIVSKKKVFRVVGVGLSMVSVVIFSLLWIQLITPNTKIHDKFIETAKGTRFIFWDIGQKAINKHPWFGYGPENYMIAFGEYFNPKMLLPEYNREGWNDRAHNIYYDIGVSGGYPAIIIYTLFLSSILYALYRARKYETLTALETSVLAGVVIGYTFQDLFYFDSVLSTIALFSLAGISYALGVPSLNNLAKDNKKKTLQIDSYYRNGLIMILLIGSLFALAHFSYSPIKKAKRYALVFGASFNKPFNTLLFGSEVGNAWDTSALAYEAYRGLAVDPLKIKNNKEVLPYILKDLDSLLKYLEEIAKNNKSDYRLYISMVDLYNTKIFLTNASNDPVLEQHLFDLLETAHNLAPTNPEIYWIKAQVYSWSGDFNNIIKSYKEAIALDPTLPTSRQLMIKFLGAIGNQKEYNEALEDAQKNISGFKLD